MEPVLPEYRSTYGVCRSGHSVQRVKTIKRQMYGRAGFVLLRARVINIA
jgi:hypothetical protein